MVRGSLLPEAALDAAAAGRFDPAELALGLKAAGLAEGGSGTAVAEALAQEVTEHARRAELERQERTSLDAADRPRYELPLLSDGVDLAGLYELAETMREQGAA
nr:hypothetical protein GCM10020093_080610 [Planobispora longispora]